MNFISSALGYSTPAAPEPKWEELYLLLEAVLPTFVAVAKERSEEAPNLSLPLTPLPYTQPLDEQLKTFYLRLLNDLTNLQSVLGKWDPTDMIQSFSPEETLMVTRLVEVLTCLEECFLSRKDKVAGPAFTSLGIEYTSSKPFCKLRALKDSEALRALKQSEKPYPRNGGACNQDFRDEDYLGKINLILRLHHKKAAKRDRLLHAVQAANENFMRDFQNFARDPTSSCPLQYRNYPIKEVSKLTKKLFDTIRSKWSCQCPSHTQREARWNLTQHQRFDTVPARESRALVHAQCYRVFFPTITRKTEWQDTDILVDSRRSLDEFNEKIDNNFCEVIHHVKSSIRPRFTVWEKELWQLRAEVEKRSSVLTRIEEAGFVSLEKLLDENSSRPIGRPSRRSLEDAPWGPKDRLILSFILATTLLQLSETNSLCRKAEITSAAITSDRIFFLRPSPRAPLDITKPYLKVSYAAQSSNHQTQSSLTLNNPHRFPDILALGILLLEIEQGVPASLDPTENPCVEAMKKLDNWITSIPESMKSWAVPEGLRHAIAACIKPEQFKTHNLQNTKIEDINVQRYIFHRIIYPLEKALCEVYEITPNMLPLDLERKKLSGPFDDDDRVYDQVDQDHKQKADNWTQYLEGVHDLVYACEDQCARPDRRDGPNRGAEQRVKIAVLDTGLQLPGNLHESYKAAGRILVNESKSFVHKNDGAASEHDWDSDDDGHGSRVGEIILRCAPCADLNVAKVFRNRDDLMKPSLADQVHKRIVDAIDEATNIWKVDILVMSFGFDKPIKSIREAIKRALKTSKPPLFFAATRNNGAHKEMAWPASEDSVFGISSTTAEGEASSFNPRASGGEPPIFYAFGQKVPVKVADPNDQDGFVNKYVSGTSYAAPIAASLAACLLGSVRMLLKASSPEVYARFADVPEYLQEKQGMVRVMRRHMLKEHSSGLKSLLPWEFLCVEMMEKNKLLKKVNEAMNGHA